MIEIKKIIEKEKSILKELRETRKLLNQTKDSKKIFILTGEYNKIEKLLEFGFSIDCCFINGVYSFKFISIRKGSNLFATLDEPIFSTTEYETFVQQFEKNFNTIIYGVYNYILSNGFCKELEDSFRCGGAIWEIKKEYYNDFLNRYLGWKPYFV